MKLTIYHTNDIHANYDFLRKVHAYMKAHKTDDDLYFDSGDFVDLRDLIVQSDLGEKAMGLLMASGLDAMTVGNGETDLGGEALSGIASKFPIVSANMTQNDDSPIPGLRSFLTFERAGKRFLVTGLSPFYSTKMVESGYNFFTMMKNLKTQEPVEYIRRVFEENKGKYDCCILLSHSGLIIEGNILPKMPEVDLCLGGHSHNVDIHEGYTQSGKGEFLGKVVLEADENGIRILSNEQIDLPEVSDPEFDALLAKKTAEADAILSEEMPAVEEISHDPLGESRLINFICDCMMKHFDGDLAVMHGGIAEGDLTKPVSKKSLVQNFPSKLNPTIVKVSGAAIREAVKASLDPEFIRQDGKGPGFRGKVLGTLGYSRNVRIFVQPFEVLINDEPLDDQREYTVIADDYLQRGTGYPMFRKPDEESSFHVWFIRDLVEHFLTDEEVYESSKVQRIFETRA